MANINWALLAPILVIELILVIVVLVDIIRIEKTNGPKWLWVLLSLFFNPIGPILYFVIGRSKS
ncbi:MULTISPECIES: PLD nuclease N-terminal domain-containing protein [Bacillus]|uniref:PLD nuclease N-terminal domain-containing protein n=1 Tax=Bacillus salipaludis TaxID=2547811 RepID=A0A4R5VPN3_9BACI|nr:MULTISPECIES: PLD nuclease N-terminal domain-containing protein [Bacillus]MDQ6599307.1 PLD nuclease N-terminal domain-containing protein [Bacillus salipaludis]TDK60409.1 PLDc_N domain-containing protein [Bacillus salipaludis]